MSLYQLVKIPVLVQHFQEHRQRDPQVGLLAFFSMHYWGQDINDDDQDQDRQLPFKEVSKVTLEPCFYPVKTLVALKPHVHFCKTDFPLTGEFFLPNPGLGSLFRPPKC